MGVRGSPGPCKCEITVVVGDDVAVDTACHRLGVQLIGNLG